MNIADILETLWLDRLSREAVCLILLVGVIGGGLLWLGVRRTRSRLEDWRVNLDVQLLHQSDPSSASSAGNPLLHGLHFMHAGKDESGRLRWRTEADVWRVLEANAFALLHGEDALSKLLCGAARHLTALALIATFLLIGVVLAGDVYRALQVPSDGHALPASNGALSHAVQLIGSKFLISALGLFLSLIFQAVESRAETEIAEKIRQAHREHARRFVTAEEIQTEQVVAAVQALERPLANLDALAASAPSRMVERLQIPIRDLLRTELRTAANVLGAHIDNEFATVAAQMKLASAESTQAINSVRDTIQKQAKSDLEALLKQLRDIVNTGYEEEAGRLREAMGTLTAGIPKLDEQLRRMVADVQGALAQHVASTAEGQTALTVRVGSSVVGVVEQLERARIGAEAYGTASERMLDELVALGKLHVEQLENGLRESAASSVRHLATLGEAAADQATAAVARATEARFKAIEKKLLDDTRAFSTGLAETSKSFGNAAVESIKHAVQALEQNMSRLSEQAETLKRAHDGAATSLLRATDALGGAAQLMTAASGGAKELEPGLLEIGRELRKVAVALSGTTVRLSQFAATTEDSLRKLVEDRLPGTLAKAFESLASHESQLNAMVQRAEATNKSVGERLATEIQRLATVIDSYADDDDSEVGGTSEGTT